MADVTVKTPRDFIREVIVTWEGRVHGWHGTVDPDGGNGYGVLGFRYGWFKKVVDAYNQAAGASLAYDDGAGLAAAAETSQMIHAQNMVANQYLKQAFDLSIRPRNIQSLVGQLVVCDIDINNGLGNDILKNADIMTGFAQGAGGYHKPHLELENHQEAGWLKVACHQRIREISHLFKRYPGLKVRYEWYRMLVDQYAYDLSLDGVELFYIRPKAFTIEVAL